VGGGGGLLTIASNLSDTGWSTGLEMNTSGTLPAGAVILTGTNTYSGGTLVSSGTLNIAEPYSLPSNTPLTVGAGGTVLIGNALAAGGLSAGDELSGLSAGGLSGLSADGMSAGGSSAGGSLESPQAVPEPASLALLTAGALLALLVQRRRRKG
jgi:autotransporter-associated beta strand protein